MLGRLTGRPVAIRLFTMLFRNLRASSALALDRYADIDQFRESERYVRAESIPLKAGKFSVLRARLGLPSCTLSLVRTFPRIINGYEMSGRLVIVIPMNDVSSARVNGQSIGRSLLLLKGSVDCTVHEPDPRLVAILSILPDALHPRLFDVQKEHLLLGFQPATLARLQARIRSLLEFAAGDPGGVHAPGIQQTIQDSLLTTLSDVLPCGRIDDAEGQNSISRYKPIVDQMDHLVGLNPTAKLNCERLADEIGVSTRTLQAAVHSVCGLGPLGYGRLRRLWSVRKQLRTGSPGLTVKASALAHGFAHMGEFSGTYRAAFGELPSQTLDRARDLKQADR